MYSCTFQKISKYDFLRTIPMSSMKFSHCKSVWSVENCPSDDCIHAWTDSNLFIKALNHWLKVVGLPKLSRFARWWGAGTKLYRIAGLIRAKICTTW